MRRMYLLLLGLCLFFFADPKPVYPQGWIPKRIVSMEYPRLAGQARIQGQVQVECAINPDGSVRSTKVSSVSGSANAHPLLAEAAQKNARKWTFMRNSESPTGSSGSVILDYSFRLEEVGSYNPRSEFVFEYPNSILVSSESWNTRITPQYPAKKK